MGNSNSKKRKHDEMEGSAARTVYQRVLKDPALVRQLAEFWDADTLCHKVSLLSKYFLKLAEERAGHRVFKQIIDRHFKGDDNDVLGGKRLISRTILKLHKNFESHTKDQRVFFFFRRKPPRPFPYRLILKVAYTVPMKKTTELPCTGLTATLNKTGNVVMVASEGMERPLIIVRDPKTLELEPLAAAPFGFDTPMGPNPLDQMMGAANWITSKLFCCNQQYLVLIRTARSLHVKWIHVWKVDDSDRNNVQVEFIRTIQVPEFPNPQQPEMERGQAESAVVGEDSSTLYLLWNRKRREDRHWHYEIQAHDLATGAVLARTTIDMPVIPDSTESPRYFVVNLVIFPHHVVLLRHYEQPGQFAGMGCGAYSFRRTDLQQTHFLPCFDEGENFSSDVFYRTNKYVVTEGFNSNRTASVYRAVVADNANGHLSLVDHPFMNRSRVIAQSSQYFFTYYGNEGTFQIDMYDSTTRQVVRTLNTESGPDHGQYMLVDAQVNQKRRELVVTLSGPDEPPCVQVFMLESV